MFGKGNAVDTIPSQTASAAICYDNWVIYGNGMNVTNLTNGKTLSVFYFLTFLVSYIKTSIQTRQTKLLALFYNH